MYNITVKNTTMSFSVSKLNVGMVPCNASSKVIDFLLTEHFPKEPLSKYFNVMESTEDVEFLKNCCARALRQNVSVYATNSDGDIAGVALNVVMRKGEDCCEALNPYPAGIAKIKEFVKRVADEADIFGKYPENEEYMYICGFAIREDYRDQGLGKRLVELTREAALKVGLKLMRLDCSDSFSSKLALKKGWTCLHEIEYENYEVNGEKVFEANEENPTFGIYVLKVDHNRFLKPSTQIAL